MSTVFVTGATGFIGANLVRALLARGKSVRALVRPSSNRQNIQGLELDLVEGTLADPDVLESAARGCDTAYHLAADYSFWPRDPDAMYATNVVGTANVMEACLRAGVGRVVHTSTVGAIGLDASSPRGADETTPLNGEHLGNHYKRSKYEAELVALGYVAKGLPLVVVNPSAPVGPWDGKPTPTGRIVLDHLLGRIPAYLDTGLNLVHVRDVAEGHILAAEKGRIGERYILGHRNMALEEILGILSRISGKPAPRLRIPYGAAWITGLVATKLADWVTRRPPVVALDAVRMAKHHMYFDSSKAVRELGLPQTPVEKALEDAVGWFAQHGYLNGTRGQLAWQSH